MAKIKLPVYDYPEKYDDHMLIVPDLAKLPVTDENYPFINNSFFFNFCRLIVYFFTYTIALPIIKISLGLKVKGKEILKSNKDLLKNGAITVCNHVHMWDYICVLLAIKPVKQYHAAWLTNLKGPNRYLIRLVGGVPVPPNIEGIKKFDETVSQTLSDGKWFHFFAEGSLWFYYDKIRPFKKGAFTYAVRNQKPVLPLVISYRERTGITKLFSKKPMLDLTICEPVLPLESDNAKHDVREMLTQCRQKMQDASAFEERIDQN